MALRMLFEGAPVTFDLLAMARRCSEKNLRALAEKKSWRVPQEVGSPTDLERRLTVLSDRLVGELEAASAEGQRAGAYDKARIDALSAMLRMVEKIGETTRGPRLNRERQSPNPTRCFSTCRCCRVPPLRKTGCARQFVPDPGADNRFTLRWKRPASRSARRWSVGRPWGF